MIRWFTIGKIHRFTLVRATRGWYVETYVSVATQRQFTNEWHEIKGGHKYLLGAIVQGFITTRRECQKLQNIKGDFAIERRGLGRWLAR